MIFPLPLTSDSRFFGFGFRFFPVSGFGLLFLCVPRLYRGRGAFGFRVLGLDRAGSRVEALGGFYGFKKERGFPHALGQWLPVCEAGRPSPFIQKRVRGRSVPNPSLKPTAEHFTAFGFHRFAAGLALTLWLKRESSFLGFGSFNLFKIGKDDFGVLKPSVLFESGVLVCGGLL